MKTGAASLFLNSQDPFGVAVGGTLGHCLCTGLAVIGGRMIAQKISVRTGKLSMFLYMCFILCFDDNTRLHQPLIMCNPLLLS